MPKIMNNKGFGVIPILVLSLVLGLGVLVGYNYYNSSNETTSQVDGSLQASAEVSGDENVLQINTPKPLPAGTTFNYVIASNRVTVSMYGNPTFVRVLTSSANRVNVRLTSSTGTQTNQTLVLANISGGKRIVFNINDTIAKIEFPAVTGILTGAKPSEWSETTTKNGLQRAIIVCNNDAPEFLICDSAKSSSSITRKIILKGCGTKLTALKSQFEKTGLFIGNVPSGSYPSKASIKGFIVNEFKATSITNNLVTYQVTHNLISGYFNDPYPYGIMDLLKNKEAIHFSDLSTGCKQMDEYINSNSAKSQSRTLDSGSRN